MGPRQRWGASPARAWISCWCGLTPTRASPDGEKRSAIERGYRHVKVHEIEAVNVKAARDVLGPDIPLMVDCNCLWDVDEAVRRARSFAPYHPHWIEEAIWPPEDGHAMAELRRTGGVPTAAG